MSKRILAALLCLFLLLTAIPYAAFLPILRDPAFHFLEEAPLPPGWRVEDVVL